MATTYKVLGQAYPTAATLTSLYTVPSATNTVVATLVATNQSGTADTINIAIRPAGASITTQHYIAYGVSVPGNGNYSIQYGITLAATDVISVYSLNGTTSFSTFGSEIA